MSATTRPTLPPPSAELHLHIEGTLEPDLVFELAARNGTTLPDAGPEELRERYAFADLQSFLDLYYANMAVLRTEEDFADMTRAYLVRAAAAGVRHAEIMVDPQAHLARGVSLATCIGGIASVLRTSEADHGVSTALVAAFLRDRPQAEALQALDDLLAMDAPIIGIGLDSAEVGHPPSGFVELFARARAAGLRCIAHACEEGPPAYGWEALDLLRVERIDHGIRCTEDDALVARLVREQTPLTVCPLSNVRLRAVDSLAEHPLPRMLAAGLNVTVSSDDPAYFGGYVDDVYRALVDELGLTLDDVAHLAAASIRSAFITTDRRAVLLDEVDRWRAGQTLAGQARTGQTPPG